MHVSGCQIIFWILLFQVVKVQGVKPEPAFKHFTTEDGLPSSQIYQALQSTDGYVWFATDKGVVKYNGYEFKTYTAKDGLTDNVVFDLFEDFKKRIWMISFSGSIYIYENNGIKLFKYNSTIRPFLKGSIQMDISVDSLENVYISCAYGQFKVDSNGTIKIIYDYDDQKGIIKLLIDDSHNFITPVGIGFVTDPRKSHVIYHLHTFGIDSIPIDDITVGRVKAVRRKNKSLLFSVGKKLYELKNNKIIERVTVDDGIINLNEDSKENLWLCTMKGLVMFSGQNNYSEKDTYLKGKYISDITEDRELGYWVTTIDDGIYYLINEKVKNYYSDSQLNAPVAFASDKSQIYAGYFSGSLARMNTKEFALIVKEVSGPEVNSMYFDTSTSKFYIGNKNLHYILNGKYYSISDSSNKIANVGFVKKRNGIFSASFGNILRIQGDSAFSVGVFKTRVVCIGTNEKDDLLLGCLDGVYCFDERKKTIRNFDPRLKDIRVDDIKNFKGNLILATQGRGLLILKKDGSLVTIDESAGLCSNILHTLCISGNTIWCGSNNGISKVSFSGNVESEYTITAINVTNGLISNEINDLEHLNDTIWVASKKGISFFKTSTNFINSMHPLVHFISLKINNIDTLVNNNYELPHTLNTIRIGFESPLFKSDGKQSYHYLLTNGEDSIGGITTNREMDFLSLRPGHYSLYVNARNNSGIMSIRPEKLNFVILAPWWQRTWFRVTGLIVLIIFGTILYRRRVSLIEHKYLIERKQASLQLTAMRAQMNPHFIFNVMDSIRNYIVEKDIDSAGKYLTSFAKLVRYTLEQSDKQECSLEEELNMIRIYIELEKERFSKLINVEIKIDPSVDVSEIMVPTMILQPFIENAFKHGLRNTSNEGLLMINVIGKDGKVSVIIEDNGISGKEKLPANALRFKKSQSYGISLVHERINSYNKAYGRNISFKIIQLNDSKGEIAGTRIVLEF